MRSASSKTLPCVDGIGCESGRVVGRADDDKPVSTTWAADHQHGRQEERADRPVQELGSRAWRKTLIDVGIYDFPSDAEGVAIPYGVYDVTRGDHETN